MTRKINKTARLLVNLNWEDFIWTQCCITSRNLECEFVSIKGKILWQTNFSLLVQYCSAR